MNALRRFVASVIISQSFANGFAADVLPFAKPIPQVSAEPLPHHQVSFFHEGRELTRYHFDPADRRPFLYPLVGPAGHSLTRMGHPHDPVGHSHHNSVWISHHSVNGVNFWADRGSNLGRIVPQRLENLTDGDDAASLLTLNDWIADQSGDRLLIERRRIEVRPLAEGETLVLIDLEFSPDKHPVTFEKTPFGLVAVRMRKSIGVHDGGGTIRNSVGGVNEKGLDGAEGVFWKPARWCDYSGVVVGSAVEGIALFDHPQNPNHPTVFHVRDDGWMGACLTFDAPRTLAVGQTLRLRYALYVHGRLPTRDAMDAQWKSFAELPMSETLVLPKAK